MSRKSPDFFNFARRRSKLYRQFQRMVEEEFQRNGQRIAETGLHEHIAIFTDTCYGIHELVTAIQQRVSWTTQNKQLLTVVTCDGENHTNKFNMQNFRPIGVYDFSDDSQSKLFFPPLMEILDFCYRKNVTRIHAATPGPMGMAALLIAKLLKLPINGTYHASLPRYAQFVIGDAFIEELAWKYTTWFYNQMDQINVPTQNCFDELAQKGIDSEKIHLCPTLLISKDFISNGLYSLAKNKSKINNRLTPWHYSF